MKKLLPLITLCFLISGCAVKFVYNQLDWVIPWYFGDYLSLDKDQEDYLDQRLEHHLRWHRRTQLPNYAQFLRQTSTHLGDGLSPSELNQMQDQLEIFGRQLTTQIAPDIAELFLSSSSSQLQQLYKKLDEDNQQYINDYIAISEQNLRQKRLSETQSYFERWIGGLSRQQKDELMAWSEEFDPIAKELLAHKVEWQSQLQTILNDSSSRDLTKQRLITLLSEPDKDWRPEYEKKSTYNKQRLSDLFLKIDALMSQRQRKKLTKKLQTLADDLDELSKKT